MGDIGPERAHYDVLPTAEDVPAPVVEVRVDREPQSAAFESRADLDVMPAR